MIKLHWPKFPEFASILAKLRDPVMILPYLGYGTSRKLALCGRVLQDEGFPASEGVVSRWQNLIDFFKRMESDEVPGARVRAAYQGIAAEATSDREGYFRIELEAADVQPGWHDVALELGDSDVRATGSVLVPPPDAEFGVISDVDDTIVHSDVLHKLHMLMTLAFSNSSTRKPFWGIAAFYRALHRGRNPIFYVSNGPWNLYVPLVEFLQRQQFPAGPLLLRDFGLRMSSDHKTKAIEHILATYPALRFILVGDSGEHDPEVYSTIMSRFPDRIRTIYIRSVDPSPTRTHTIERLIEKVAASGCQLVLAPDSEFAAAHAAAEGLIPAAELEKVRSEKNADRAGVSPSP
jgi:phosphatidate phosphatase APP1